MPDTTRIPTNLRMLRIIEIIAGADGPLSPTEINRGLGLPKASIHRLCDTLVSEGYLSRDVDPKKLRPARRLRQLSARIMSASHLHVSRHQVLEGLSRAVGETVNFVVPEDDGMRYLDRVETQWAFRIALPIGSHVPFHCTASGKCFMASLPEPDREHFVGSLDLSRHTDRTFTSPPDLLDELGRVAARGYAIDDEEFMTGMVAIAKPLTDGAGRFFAALAIHGPTLRISIPDLEQQLPRLAASADQLRALLLASPDRSASPDQQ